MANQTNDPAPAQMCEESPASCKYNSIGCQWKGTTHEAYEHEEVCAYPEMSGAELMCLSAFQAGELAIEEKNEKTHIDVPFIELLSQTSFKSFIFLDLQMTRYLTDDNVQNLWYKTIRFTAFNHQWVLKAKMNKDQQHRSCNREINYQLILKTKTSCPLNIRYIAFKDVSCNTEKPTNFHKQDFTDTESKSDYNRLPFPNNTICPDCNSRLDDWGIINFRFIMVLL